MKPNTNLILFLQLLNILLLVAYCEVLQVYQGCVRHPTAKLHKKTTKPSSPKKKKNPQTREKEQENHPCTQQRIYNQFIKCIQYTVKFVRVTVINSFFNSHFMY